MNTKQAQTGIRLDNFSYMNTFMTEVDSFHSDHPNSSILLVK